MSYYKILILGWGLVFLFSCRGEISKEPPIHPNVNMDFQSKKGAQQYSRYLPDGVVAYGYKTDAESKAAKREAFLQSDVAYYTGKLNGEYIKRIPEKVDRDYLLRGQKNYNIYCAVCHDRAGTGQGIVIKRGVGIPPPPVLADNRLVKMRDGEIFEIVSEGRRIMPAYATQIVVEDRWAIVAYVRALQLARRATVEDVPGGKESLIK